MVVLGISPRTMAVTGCGWIPVHPPSLTAEAQSYSHTGADLIMGPGDALQNVVENRFNQTAESSPTWKKDMDIQVQEVRATTNRHDQDRSSPQHQAKLSKESIQRIF